jgi:hypothetical protein
MTFTLGTAYIYDRYLSIPLSSFLLCGRPETCPGTAYGIPSGGATLLFERTGKLHHGGPFMALVSDTKLGRAPGSSPSGFARIPRRVLA